LSSRGRLERDKEFGAEGLWVELVLGLKVLRMRGKVFVMFVEVAQTLMVPEPRKIGDRVRDMKVRVLVQPSFDVLG
jgi:hypothetical protein